MDVYRALKGGGRENTKWKVELVSGGDAQRAIHKTSHERNPEEVKPSIRKIRARSFGSTSLPKQRGKILEV